MPKIENQKKALGTREKEYSDIYLFFELIGMN